MLECFFLFYFFLFYFLCYNACLLSNKDRKEKEKKKLLLLLYTALKVYAHALSLLRFLCISEAELQRHILVWHVFYNFFCLFQSFRVYADIS